jgi:hypothetical protein
MRLNDNRLEPLAPPVEGDIAPRPAFDVADVHNAIIANMYQDARISPEEPSPFFCVSCLRMEQ